MPSLSAPQLSVALVAYLRQQGKTLREIGEMIGLSESFISRVAKGERSFTIDHLGLFERQLGEPLPALVAQAMWGRDLSDDERATFDEAVRLLRELGRFRGELGAVDRSGDADGESRDQATKNAGKPRRAAG